MGQPDVERPEDGALHHEAEREHGEEQQEHPPLLPAEQEGEHERDQHEGEIAVAAQQAEAERTKRQENPFAHADVELLENPVQGDDKQQHAVGKGDVLPHGEAVGKMASRASS